MFTKHQRERAILLATEYADQSVGDASEEFIIPEDLASLDDAALEDLMTAASGHFDSLYGDGSGLTDEDIVNLKALTEGIEALAAERAQRDEAAAARAEEAAALAARIRGEEATEEDEETSEEENAADDAPVSEETEEDESDEVTEEENAAEVITASAPAPRRSFRIPMAAMRGRVPSSTETPSAQKTIKDVLVASADGLGVASGTGIDWSQAGEMLNRRAASFNSTAYANAAKAGRAVREQHAFLSIKRDIPEALTIRNDNPEHVESVLDYATSEKSLPQGSLVASGGWCAPSETMYDLIELESRDGLLSIPEVGISRGGVSFTKGPSFADLYSDIPGFHYTEADDIAGTYEFDADAEELVEGPKPCYKVDCPEFEEHRLDVTGICITAGLLASKGYPEYLARVVRGALVAHEHRLNGRIISQMASESTAVTMPSVQAGAAAPILTSIELQVEHYKYTHRLSRGTTLEAVFPFWVRGAIRADLARRQGVELLAVTDAQINSWFAQRGVAPQFVYNWQAIDGTAAANFTSYPNEVTFLLYTAGTWLRGSSDLITMDTVYDSSLIRYNDFTALFTEEGYFVAQRGLDSRAVSLTFSADGATHQGIDIAHNGTEVIAEDEVTP